MRMQTVVDKLDKEKWQTVDDLLGSLDLDLRSWEHSSVYGTVHRQLTRLRRFKIVESKAELDESGVRRVKWRLTS